MKYFLICLTFLVTSAFAQNLDSTNKAIADEYPTFRQLGATYSTLFGAMAIWQGGLILGKDKPGNDNFLATATVVVGSMRLVDGSVGLFRQSEAERMANKNEIQDTETLQRLARDSFYIRIIRSSLIAANSALFLALYSKGDDDYKMLVYPGVIMGVIATFNLFRLTPEEKAAKGEDTKSFVELAPVKNGGALVFTYKF